MRIASLSPATTEILFAIGAGELVVCTDWFSDEPEAVRALPHLKDHQRIDPEALRAHKPEIVFTSTLVQRKLAEELRKAEQWAVIHQDPRSINEVCESIRQIGQIVEREREARALIERMQSGFVQVKKKAGLLPRKPRIYVEEWHHPPMVSGNWVPEVVHIAGGKAFPIPSPEPSREVALEEIQRFDPDMIVLSICGAGKLAEKSLLTSRPGWDCLRAVSERCLFVIDDSLLNRPGPRLVEGAQRLYGWMFELMH